MFNSKVAIVFTTILVVAIARSPPRPPIVPILGGGNANAGGTGHVGLGDVTANGFSSSSAFNGGAASGTGIGTAQGGGLTPFGLLGGSATGSGTTFTQG